MHTVFLVEDEPLIRQNIRNNIEKSTEPYTCIGEAGDGELALSIIQDLKPDILITDIKMPFMDGLTLARHARAIIPWLRIIIVSGYDDFELARQAICVGVDQYLLKPVAGKDLFGALHKASEQITEHKRHSVSFLKEATDEEMVKNTLVSTLLEQLCGGEITADEALRRADELGIDILSKRYVVLISLVEGKGGHPNRQAIASKVKYMLGKIPTCCYFLSGVDHVVLIIKGTADIDVTEKAYHTAQTLKHEVEDDGNTLLTVSISSVTPRISGIHDAFHEAGILLKTFGQTNRGRIFCTGDIGRIQSPVAASAGSFFNVNIENKLKFAIAEDVPAIVEEFTKNLEYRRDAERAVPLLYPHGSHQYRHADHPQFQSRHGPRRDCRAFRGPQAGIPVRHVRRGVYRARHTDLPEDHRAAGLRQQQPSCESWYAAPASTSRRITAAPISP